MPSLLVAVLLGCSSGPDVLPGVQADEAWLESVELGTVAVLGGPVSGSGVLVIVDGTRLKKFPVRLRGGTIGGVLEAGVSWNMAKVELELPRARVDADDLLGRYKGLSGGLTVLGGFDSQSLKNKHGVRLRARPFQVGLSVHVGYEWLKMSLVPEVSDETAWETGYTGESGCNCSGYSLPRDTVDETGDTSPVDTGSQSLVLLGLLGWAARRRRS